MARRPDPADLADALARWEAGELGAAASPAEVAELRAELEAVAREAAAEADLSGNPIRLSKRTITELLACERHLAVTVDDGPGSDGEALHLGVLVDALAELHVGSGRDALVPEPLEVALDICRHRGDDATLAWVDGLDRAARADLADRLDEKRTKLLATWPAFRPEWWPRTQEKVTVSLADGDVVLSGRADVTVGGPPTPWPVLLVEVKSGNFTIDQRDDGLVYALLLAARDGVAPAAAITTTAERGVHVELATASRLETAALRVGEAIRAAGELAAGRPPREQPGVRCDRCPVRRTCASARLAS